MWTVPVKVCHTVEPLIEGTLPPTDPADVWSDWSNKLWVSYLYILCLPLLSVQVTCLFHWSSGGQL